MPSTDPVTQQQVIDHLFRHQSGKMIAALSRIFGIHNLSLVEDVVQEAFLKAMQVWPLNALPDNPAGWLMQTAKNKAIDIIRRKQHFDKYSKLLSHELAYDTESAIDHFFLDSEIADSQLRLIFACCHPLLKEEDQLALTLKIVSGFGTREIAQALVSSESGIEKRLYRARQFIKENKIQLEIPTGDELLNRLETVYTILYLIFNEGYNSSKADELIRHEICAEAMRLCLILSEHKKGKNPNTYALLSLMCLQASRFESRMDKNNAIILLQHQDRSKWNHPLIQKGYEYLSLSSAGEHISVYHIESAIAAEHCMASHFETTNWERMLTLYDLLLTKKSTPTVILNRAIVLAHLQRVKEAVKEVENIPGLAFLIETQYIYNAVLGDLHLKNRDYTSAAKFLEQALHLTNSQSEKCLIAEKLDFLKRSN